MEYLTIQLKDGTMYIDYLNESTSYRQELYDRFAQQVLFTPMDEDDLKRYAEQITTELLPHKDLFMNEDDYNEVFQETLTELVPY